MSELVGLIPAAGKGVRAYPYTATIPKSMLEVDGVPVLRRNVELMRERLGIRDIYIVVGYQGEVIRRYFGEGRELGVRITYVTNQRVDLELPYSVHLAGQHITGPCCMILADECYVGSNHGEILSRADPEAVVTCGLIASEYSKQIRKNYVVALRDGLIVDLVEKPSVVSGRMMGTGTYLLQPELFRRLAEAYAAGPESGPRDWTTWLASLARSGVRVAPAYLTGKYVNINSRDDLNHANYLVRDLHFDEKRTSLVYVIDDGEDTAVDVMKRFAGMVEVDELVAVARRAVPELERAAAGKVRLVVAEPETPIGDLVRLGLDSASGSILLIAPSDDTFSPRDISKILVYLRDADMVVGTRTTRQMIEQGTNMRGVVRAVHIVLAKLLQLLWWRFESRFTDFGCIYRGLWRSTYDTIRDNLTAKGVEIYPEMVIEVLRAQRRIVEIPVNYYNRDLLHSHVRGKYQSVLTFVQVLALLFKKRWDDLAVVRWFAVAHDHRPAAEEWAPAARRPQWPDGESRRSSDAWDGAPDESALQTGRHEKKSRHGSG
jgi:NDP-sugar pyrophosphorylase family protein